MWGSTLSMSIRRWDRTTPPKMLRGTLDRTGMAGIPAKEPPRNPPGNREPMERRYVADGRGSHRSTLERFPKVSAKGRTGEMED